MGIDLVGTGLHYNWNGWKWLVENLESWGVDVSELKFFNDGDPISAETCVAIAAAIESNISELDDDPREWIASHIEAWRKCDGCEQW